MRYVFIHGAGCNSEVFAAQRDAFSESVALDLPAHGKAGGYADTIEGFADAVAADLERLEIQRAVLCGSSMGGAIALELALRRHPSVHAAVLLGSGARLRVAPAIFSELLHDFEAAAHTLACRMFAVQEARLIDAVATMLLATGRTQTVADFRACDAFDRVERLGEIAVPVLALTGEHDQLTPPKYASLAAGRIPGAQARIVEAAGHLAMLERPRETNAALASFLERLA
ncbi:MAG TPA: alpha/beta fold hydrolase [Candidatus Tyrphobacter sp.]